MKSSFVREYVWFTFIPTILQAKIKGNPPKDKHFHKTKTFLFSDSNTKNPANQPTKQQPDFTPSTPSLLVIAQHLPTNPFQTHQFRGKFLRRAEVSTGGHQWNTRGRIGETVGWRWGQLTRPLNKEGPITPFGCWTKNRVFYLPNHPF